MQKYHQDAGPLRISSAVELEHYLGDEIREEYPYFTDRGLHGALQKRRRSVLLDHRVVRTWLEKYAPRRIIRKQSAVGVWGKAGLPAAKRPAVAASVKPVSGAAELEELVGDRYRSTISDLGLGHGERDMCQNLLDWGYDASREACRTWISSYRIVAGGIYGNASVYTLSRQDLQRWYYVDKLTETQLQKKYLTEHGVYAHRKNLTTWLQADAQKPEKPVNMFSRNCSKARRQNTSYPN